LDESDKKKILDRIFKIPYKECPIYVAIGKSLPYKYCYVHGMGFPPYDCDNCNAPKASMCSGDEAY